MKEKIRRRNRVVDTAVFAVLLFAVSAVTLALFLLADHREYCRISFGYGGIYSGNAGAE